MASTPMQHWLKMRENFSLCGAVGGLTEVLLSCNKRGYRVKILQAEENDKKMYVLWFVAAESSLWVKFVSSDLRFCPSLHSLSWYFPTQHTSIIMPTFSAH